MFKKCLLSVIMFGGLLGFSNSQCSFFSRLLDAISYVSGGVAIVSGYLAVDPVSSKSINKPLVPIALVSAGISGASYVYRRFQRAALLNGISDNDIEQVRSALKRGANPNVDCGFSLYGRTALMYAIVDAGFLNKNKAKTDFAIIKLLIEYGADVNKTDFYGITPLMLAASKIDNPLPLVNLLLESGAEVNAQVPEAELGLFEEFTRYRERVNYCYAWYGAYPEQTALHTAATPEVYQALLAAGADEDVLDYFSKLPKKPLARSERSADPIEAPVYSAAYSSALASLRI